MKQETIDRNNQLIIDYKLNSTIKELSQKYKLSERGIAGILQRNKVYKRKFRGNEDLLNKTFGKLKVIELIEPNNLREKRKWLCQCECGNKKIFNARWLKECKTQINCGCIQKNYKHKLYFKGFGEISKSFFNTIKRGADRRNIQFNITMEQIWNLFIKQNGKCALSGVSLELGKFSYDTNTASLDRIDNSKGYIVDNIQWLHKDINLMKSSFNEQYFLECCNKISDYKHLNSTPLELINK